MRVDHILEKGTGHQNEDFLIIEKNLFGVFDGASSLDKEQFEGGKTGGMIAAGTAGRIFSRNHYPLSHLGAQANQAILSEMKQKNIDFSQRHKLWSTSAAVVRVKKNSIEWFQTGDAHIILLYKDGSHKVLVERDDHDYETLLMLKKLKFKPAPAYQSQIKKIRAKMNRTYGVLNGEPEAMDFVNTGFEPSKEVKTILIFTDGLQLPSRTPRKKKNFDGFIQIYKKSGLCGLKNHIRQIEAQDQDINTYPRFKCHDDVAAIAIHL